MARRKGTCAYCGREDVKVDREHVIPRCLYPASKAGSKVQRITVPSCHSCNHGWSDDEAHFRNVLMMAGEANDAVTDLWSGKTRRALRDVDGYRRASDLLSIMEEAQVRGVVRHKIFPARDPRVLRVVRKIVRGLVYHHGLGAAVPDTAVWAGGA